ncbi:GNAT family N-acetyltransferase [Pedobacter paludis]|uniref:GNAT family N-acetyltransferase n=1 Tax=Pedobacter paludis TaxID=2203212 RepID=A0A317ETY1_9SPHI|nr:GNAT family N-acetyltransferase [Pedobacter paludis]PWS29872.1 GNAT family N-acetyltransferase [Pedobacter paludis]
MQNIEITPVTLSDIEKLQGIAEQTFSVTFSNENSEENLADYLGKAFSLEKLTSELNNENSAFYFAIFEHKIIGYLKINFGAAQTEPQDNAMEIERVYVLKAFHGKKVAQQLFNKAIQIAKQANAEYVWLGVWEENPRAISFYTKNGFVEFDRHSFTIGNDVQQDLMMKLVL